jgi:hypothetical protein
VRLLGKMPTLAALAYHKVCSAATIPAAGTRLLHRVGKCTAAAGPPPQRQAACKGIHGSCKRYVITFQKRVDAASSHHSPCSRSVCVTCILACLLLQATGRKPAPPNQRLGYTENFMYMLDGTNSANSYRPHPKLVCGMSNRAFVGMLPRQCQHNCALYARVDMATVHAVYPFPSWYVGAR